MDGAPCPECGMRIDSSFVILQDDIGEETEPPFRKYRRWFVMTLILLFGAFVAAKLYARASATILIGLWPIALLVIVTGWHRLAAWRRSHMQLWMHASGLELIASTEEARRASWWTQTMSIAIGPIGMFVSFATSRDGEIRFVMFCMGLTFTILALLLLALYRRANPRITVRAGDFERRLLPWPQLEQFDILKPQPGRIQVRFMYRARLIGPLDYGRQRVQIEAPFDEGRYAALRKRLDQWFTRAIVDMRSP